MLYRLLLALVILGSFLGFSRLADARSAQNLANLTADHQNIGLHEIALTFDDGPNPVYTPRILHILQLYHVHATFFNIGQQVQMYPQITREVYAEGNVVDNHSWSHPNFTKLSAAQINWQINMTEQIIQHTIGTRPEFIRLPYGATNAFVQRQITQDGLIQVRWTVDTNDWRLPGVAAIESVAINQAQNGGIILMHDGGGDRSQTVAALPDIIQTLQQRGFQFYTI
jgi:peptidoglycan-N-acetylglucosamine deacetylase